METSSDILIAKGPALEALAASIARTNNADPRYFRRFFLETDASLRDRAWNLYSRKSRCCPFCWSSRLDVPKEHNGVGMQQVGPATCMMCEAYEAFDGRWRSRDEMGETRERVRQMAGRDFEYRAAMMAGVPKLTKAEAERTINVYCNGVLDGQIKAQGIGIPLKPPIEVHVEVDFVVVEKPKLCCPHWGENCPHAAMRYFDEQRGRAYLRANAAEDKARMETKRDRAVALATDEMQHRRKLTREEETYVVQTLTTAERDRAEGRRKPTRFDRAVNARDANVARWRAREGAAAAQRPFKWVIR